MDEGFFFSFKYDVTWFGERKNQSTLNRTTTTTASEAAQKKSPEETNLRT